MLFVRGEVSVCATSGKAFKVIKYTFSFRVLEIMQFYVRSAPVYWLQIICINYWICAFILFAKCLLFYFVCHEKGNV